MRIILAHGSPDERHRRQVRELASKVAERLAEPVEAGFLDDRSLPAGAFVLPLFLGEGKHGEQDAARLAGQSACRLLSSLALSADRLAGMAADLAEETSPSPCPVLFTVYRFKGFDRFISGLKARENRFPEMGLASLHGQPDCASILERWRSGGTRRVTVQPAFLFQGHTMECLNGCMREGDFNMNWEIGSPLAAHPEFPGLLAEIFMRGEGHSA